MAETKKHQPGTFIWADLATTNAGKAIEFYGSLLGWTMKESPVSSEDSMTYWTAYVGDKKVCGMGELPKEMQDQGIPTNWTPYIQTPNVDEWCQKAKELGGTVQMPPMDILQEGRMAVLQEPSGGVFGLWQPKNHTGAQLQYAPGSVCWNELMTKDFGTSKPFYEQLCGWSSKTSNINGADYTVYSIGEAQVAGSLQMDAQWGDAPSHWMVYFAVVNCDESAKKVEALGGNVCVPPTDIPGIGRFSVINDPMGATFSIIQMSESA